MKTAESFKFKLALASVNKVRHNRFTTTDLMGLVGNCSSYQEVRRSYASLMYDLMFAQSLAMSLSITFNSTATHNLGHAVTHYSCTLENVYMLLCKHH